MQSKFTPNHFNIPQYNAQRFRRHLPFLSKMILNPLGLGIFVSILALVSLVFSVHYSLSLIILILPLTSYYLERGFLDRILLPPFSILALHAAFGSGLGIALIIFSRSGEYDPYLMRVQIVTLFSISFGWAFYRLGFGKLPILTFPESGRTFDHDVVRPLVWCGWFLLVFQLIRTLILASTGNLDRGYFGAVAVNQSHFGFWTYLNLFPRFESFGFVLVPLVWHRSESIARIAFIPILAAYFLVAFVSGSRGIVIFPIIFIVVGYFFFRHLRWVKLDRIGFLMIIAFLPFIVFIDAYRNTDAYRETRSTDIIGRLGAVDDALFRMSTLDEKTGIQKSSYFTLGAALLGKSDQLIYQMTPNFIPHAGFDNFVAIYYTFAPTYLFPGKPFLLDSNMILWRYLDREDRVGRAISLPADGYRRFGWLGIPPVVAFFFWLYGFVSGRFYKIYLTKDALLGIFLILYLLSYFQNPPFGTVLESWWQMSYNLAKHIVVLFIGYWILKKVLGVRTKHGAWQYGRKI